MYRLIQQQIFHDKSPFFKLCISLSKEGKCFKKIDWKVFENHETTRLSLVLKRLNGFFQGIL